MSALIDFPVPERPVHRPGAHRPPTSPAALIGQAWADLAESRRETDPNQRFAVAYLAALRGAAAMLALRGRPHRGRARPTSAWVLLANLAPELDEWALFFASSSATRAAVQAGVTRLVTQRAADDMTRQTAQFLDLIATAISTAGTTPVPASAPTTAASTARTTAAKPAPSKPATTAPSKSAKPTPPKPAKSAPPKSAKPGKSAQSKPTQSKPTQSKPTQPKPARSKSAPSKAAQSKPAQSKAAQSKPSPHATSAPTPAPVPAPAHIPASPQATRPQPGSVRP